MTMIDSMTVQWLNLLRGSPSFVIRIHPRTHAPTVVQVEVVPDDDGIYWLAGTTTLPRGDRIPSVFEIGASADGSLAGVHCKINETWMSPADTARVRRTLDAEGRDLFPFAWTDAVRLARDAYHDDTSAAEGTA